MAKFNKTITTLKPTPSSPANGFGTYTHTNGTTYVGKYVDGLREGQGTWTIFNGRKFVGKWKNNRRWNGKSLNHPSKNYPLRTFNLFLTDLLRHFFLCVLPKNN